MRIVLAVVLGVLAFPVGAQDVSTAYTELNDRATAYGRTWKCGELGFNVSEERADAFAAETIRAAGLVIGHDSAVVLFNNRSEGEFEAIAFSDIHLFDGLDQDGIARANASDFKKWMDICNQYADDPIYNQLIGSLSYAESITEFQYLIRLANKQAAAK